MGTKASMMAAVCVVLSGVACGSTVTIDSTGGGGASVSSSAGGSADGGAGATGGATVDGGAAGFGAGGAGASGGGGALGGEGGAAPSCPGAGDACTGCMSAGCPAVYCACYDEIHCGGYLQCLGTCMQGDSACAQNCATVHEPGISAAVLVADCAATTCDASCGFGQPLAPCQKCLYSDCSEQMNTCIAAPECVALIACIQMCSPGDPACGQACVAQHPDGLAPAQAVRDCRIDSCGAVCG